MSQYKPIVVAQNFHNAKEVVWQAITDVDQMRQWYFENIPELKTDVGFKTQFNVQSGDRNFLHQWKVTEAVPEKKFVYNWKYAGYEGDAQVYFEITDINEGVKLTVTSSGIESFPQDIPEFKRESCRAGWEYFINDRLKKYLQKASGPGS